MLLKRLSLATSGTLFALLLVIFLLAALLSFGFLAAQGARWRQENVLAGVALGMLNFGNIFCYLKAHVALKEHPSVVFAGMNMGVIVLGALVGAGLFRERLSRVNVAGVALALVVLADVAAVLVGSVALLPQAVKPHAIVAAATTDNAVVVTVGVVRFMV